MRRWLPRLAEKRGLDEGLLLGAFAVMPVEWMEPAITALHKDEALRRIGDRDPDDWPSVAVAIELSGRDRPSQVSDSPIPRSLQVASIEVWHRLGQLSMELQSPMQSPGEPIHRTARTIAGQILHRMIMGRYPRPRQTVAIWTCDQDYEGVGMATIRTGDLLRLLGE